jgi:hypothetical protein
MGHHNHGDAAVGEGKGGDENKSAEAPAESDVTPPAGTTNSSQEK